MCESLDNFAPWPRKVDPANNLKIYNKNVPEDVHTLTGNGFISYFRWAANRINVSILISQQIYNRSASFEKADSFWNGDSSD